MFHTTRPILNSAATLCIWDATDPNEAEKWERLWQQWPDREVFAHPHYVGLYKTPSSRPLCAALHSSNGMVLYPFLLRDLTAESYWPPDAPPAFDLITPYGYGGPFVWPYHHAEQLAGEFWPLFDEWAIAQNIVSEFVRFHLFDQQVLPYPEEKVLARQNVVRSLDLDPAALWMDVKHKVRKNVNRARREGVTVEIDPQGEKLTAFLDIYYGTMARRDADEKYFFPCSYFEMLQRELPGQFMYFHAVHGGRVISSELVLVSQQHIYSFLGGHNQASFDLRPNDLLKYEIIGWARAQQKCHFVLGGGYSATDGIYEYKLSFAPQGTLPFYIGHRILQPDLYQALYQSRAALAQSKGENWVPKDSHFPIYRA